MPPDMEWEDDQFVMISGIQHYSYCPRQWALIHREQVFEENVFTLQGTFAHERADEVKTRQEDDVTISTGLSIWSNRLGITGRCDVVEFRKGIPVPVEYKHGRRKSQIHDELQLCAQVICLEEMFHKTITTGVIYHISSKRRRDVSITTELRDQVAVIIQEIREWTTREVLPPAVHDRRCDNCSLITVCMPHLTSGRSGHDWRRQIEEE